MRELQLTPENLLPAITPQDLEFAMNIVKEYDLPEDEITWLIRSIRNSLQHGFLEIMDDSRLKATYQELFAQDVEIKGITINTNKGAINIKSSDSLYELYFKRPLQRVRLNFKETLNSEIDFLTSLSERSSFAKTLIYFDGTELKKKKMRMNNAIFDFILYFKIGGPVKTEKEYYANPTTGQDYKHYKNGIVKNRKKKYLRDPYFN